MKGKLYFIILFILGITSIYSIENNSAIIEISYNGKYNINFKEIGIESTIIDNIKGLDFFGNNTKLIHTKYAIKVLIFVLSNDQIIYNGKKYDVYRAKMRAEIRISDNEKKIKYIKSINEIKGDGKDGKIAEVDGIKKINMQIQQILINESEKIRNAIK